MKERIEINPNVMFGKPVIRGTRIPVELLICKLSEGAAETDLLDAYPRLTKDDIHAALRYAVDMMANEMILVQSVVQESVPVIVFHVCRKLLAARRAQPSRQLLLPDEHSIK